MATHSYISWGRRKCRKAQPAKDSLLRWWGKSLRRLSADQYVFQIGVHALLLMTGLGLLIMHLGGWQNASLSATTLAVMLALHCLNTAMAYQAGEARANKEMRAEFEAFADKHNKRSMEREQEYRRWLAYIRAAEPPANSRYYRN